MRSISGDRPSQQLESVQHNRASCLQRSPLFRHVDAGRVQAMLQDTGTRRVDRGGFYFRRGDRAVEAYVLLWGRVKLVSSDSAARRAILRFVSPLEPFGHEAALGGARHLASAQATEDSEALTWPAAAMTRIMTSHPVLAHNSLRLMAERIYSAWERFQGLLTDSVEQRTARALLMLGARIGRAYDNGTVIELRLPRRDLAAFVGTTPYTMSRIISRWRRLRIVDAGRCLVMIRPRRLGALLREHGVSSVRARNVTRGERTS